MAMTQQDVASQYAKTASKTVPTGPLLLVALYDRLADDLELAKHYIGIDDCENANDSLQHAQKIVLVLRSSLQADRFDGGENLLRLYNTLIDLLVKANLAKDASVITICQDIVGPLHAAWAEAVSQQLEKEALLVRAGLA